MTILKIILDILIIVTLFGGSYLVFREWNMNRKDLKRARERFYGDRKE